MNIQETVPLLLALYQKVTLSRASTQASKQIFQDVNQLIKYHGNIIILLWSLLYTAGAWRVQ